MAMRMRSPNELLEKGKEVMLQGRDPITQEDWELMVNFWAANVAPEVQPSAVILMCRIFEVPVDDRMVRAICDFQCARR